MPFRTPVKVCFGDIEGQNVTVCVKADNFEKIEVPGWLRKALTNDMERFNAK